MKLAAFFCLGLILSVTCRADPPKTKEEFLAAVRAAYQAQDVRRVHELTWEKGMSDFDKNQEQQMLDMMVYNNGIESVSFQPLPADFMDTPVAWGRRIEPTHPAEGIIQVDEKPKEKDSASSVSMPYAVIDGGYYLVTAKTTDLGWKGPQDKTLNVTVTGAARGDVKIHVKYNASGVDLERDQSSPSSAFPGQYISEVTVRSDRDGTDVTLELLGEKGRAYYKSAPLKGKGEIHYHKGDETAGTQ
jgi:hypothetical protein